MRNLKSRVEIGRFSDERLMLRVRFIEGSNFRIEGSEATWVPTLDEVYHLKEVLDITNEYNGFKRFRKNIQGE